MRMIYAALVLICVCAACSPAPVEPAVINAPPVITDVIYAPDTMATQDHLISCIAHDPDGDPLTYAWAAEGGQFSGSGADVVYVAPDTMGDYELVAGVTDGRGGSDNRSFSMRVLTNADGTTTPVVTLAVSATSVEPFKVKRTVKIGTRTKIVCLTDSSMGHDLQYTWSSGGGILKGEGLDSGSCSVAFFIAPPTVKHYLVTVTAAGKNGSRAEGQVDFDVFCCPRN